MPKNALYLPMKWGVRQILLWNYFRYHFGQTEYTQVKIFREIVFHIQLQFLMSEKLQNESSPNFFKYSSRILPRISLRIFPNFLGEFSCFISWETETRKKITKKSPPFFQCEIPRQLRRKKSTKVFWRAGKATVPNIFRCFYTVTVPYAQRDYFFRQVICLASRKRCDFENAETLRFEIAPPKNRSDFFISESLVTFDLSLLFHTHTHKRHCDFQFAISKRIDSRFHSAIFSAISLRNLWWELRFLNLRFEKCTAIAIAIFLGTLRSLCIQGLAHLSSPPVLCVLPCPTFCVAGACWIFGCIEVQFEEKKSLVALRIDQESPRQTKPKKGSKRKVHEFSPIFCEFWCFFLGKNKRDSHRTFVPECPREKFMNWPFFGLVCRGDSWIEILENTAFFGYIEDTHPGKYR